MKKIIKIVSVLAVLMMVITCCIACDSSDTPAPEDPSLKSFEGLTFESLTVDYNGTEHKIEIAGTLPAGASVSYSNNTATDAGVYNATATVTCEGYNTKTLSATLTVNKINYDMSGAKWSYVESFVYDTTEKNVTVSELPEGVTVNSYTANKATDAGSYNATVTFNYDTKNYNTPTMSACAWVIEKAYITVNVEFDSATVEYDAKPHSITITGNIPAGTTVSYTYNGKTVNSVTEVGDYTVVAVISGKNYHPLEFTSTLKIKSTEEHLYSICFDGDIYFQNPLDGNKLYKVEGDDVVKINNDVPEYFFTDGTNLYYYSSSLFSKVIKKIDSQGTVSTVFNVNGEYITSDGEYVYYAVNGLLTKEENRGVFRFALDGSNDAPEKLLSVKAAYLCIEGNYLYYSNLSDGKKLYRSALDGSANTCIHNEKVEYIISDNGILYFDSTNKSSAIYKYNTSTGTATKMTTDSGKYLTKIGNDIYYVNNDLLTSTLFGDGIYKIAVTMSGSSSGTKVLSTENNGYSSLVGDGEYLYYYKLNDKHFYCYDPTTGEETDLMANFVPPVEEVILIGDVNIAEYKGEIYYINPTDGSGFGACLYKYNTSTKSHVKVLSDAVAGFWFNGDYMYYSTCILNNYALYRMDMTTGDIIKINSDRCENLIFEGDDIYYINVTVGFANSIMKISATDPTAEPTVIYKDKNIALTGMYKVDNTFYFVMNPNVGFQKIHKYTIGESKATDLGSKAFYVAVIGETLYFYDDSANAIKSCGKDGKDVKTVVSNVNVNELYTNGTKLYFSSIDKTVGVFVYDTANSKQTKISDTVGAAFTVVNGELWFIQTAVTYTADYPIHSGNGDGALYCYNGTSVTKK